MTGIVGKLQTVLSGKAISKSNLAVAWKKWTSIRQYAALSPSALWRMER